MRRRGPRRPGQNLARGWPPRRPRWAACAPRPRAPRPPARRPPRADRAAVRTAAVVLRAGGALTFHTGCGLDTALAARTLCSPAVIAPRFSLRAPVSTPRCAVKGAHPGICAQVCARGLGLCSTATPGCLRPCIAQQSKASPLSCAAIVCDMQCSLRRHLSTPLLHADLWGPPAGGGWARLTRSARAWPPGSTKRPRTRRGWRRPCARWRPSGAARARPAPTPAPMRRRPPRRSCARSWPRCGAPLLPGSLPPMRRRHGGAEQGATGPVPASGLPCAQGTPMQTCLRWCAGGMQYDSPVHSRWLCRHARACWSADVAVWHACQASGRTDALASTRKTGRRAFSPIVLAALCQFRVRVLHKGLPGTHRAGCAPRRRAGERERAAAAAALADARREAAERAREVEALAALSLRGDATVQECMAQLRVRALPPYPGLARRRSAARSWKPEHARADKRAPHGLGSRHGSPVAGAA